MIGPLFQLVVAFEAILILSIVALVVSAERNSARSEHHE